MVGLYLNPSNLAQALRERASERKKHPKLRFEYEQVSQERGGVEWKEV